MRVGIVALPNTFDSALASVLDVLRVAELLRATSEPLVAPIERVVLGLGPSATTANGLLVTPDRLLEDVVDDDLDVLVVPALGALTVSELRTALAQTEVRALIARLRRRPARRGPVLAGACTGTFVLAEAGRLDGAIATTSWWLADEFARRYPQIELDVKRMLVPCGPLLTAGAAFAHIDLAMALVARVSQRLARDVARHLLVDERPTRTIDTLSTHLDANDELASDFETLVRERLEEPLAVHVAADALGTTRRTLERHVRERTGQSPHQVIVRMRLERARHLRRTSRRTWDQIAPLVGYRSGAALRRGLRRSERAPAEALSV